MGAKSLRDDMHHLRLALCEQEMLFLPEQGVHVVHSARRRDGQRDYDKVSDLRQERDKEAGHTDGAKAQQVRAGRDIRFLDICHIPPAVSAAWGL